MEWLHPVTLEQEVSVDVEVARIIAADFSSESVHNIFPVQVLADIAKSRVAKVAGVFTLSTDVVNILASSLVWPDHSIVAVDACWDTRPNALAVVAVLDETQTPGKCVVHGLAFTLIEHSGVSTFSAGHWLVELVLGQTISQTVANEDGLQVNVALLVRKDLRSENRDVVTGI